MVLYLPENAISCIRTYICNPEKTDGYRLISSFSCSWETAEFEFRSSLSKTPRKDGNLAYHIVQSFAPGEVTPEEAHRIGEELADRFLKGNYSYVVATHTDKQSVHNHVIFCAADNFSHKKFNSCKRSYYQIRRLSDELCREHNLSIIAPTKTKGKTYKEWKESRAKNSWKDKMRLDIDEAIREASSYDEFLSQIRAKGYEVKGERPEGETLKYISFWAPGQQKFVRGSERSLGAKYTRNEIIRRISERDRYTPKSVHPHEQDILKRTAVQKTLFDTSADKFQNSPGSNTGLIFRTLRLLRQLMQRPEILRISKQKSVRNPMKRTIYIQSSTLSAESLKNLKRSDIISCSIRRLRPTGRDTITPRTKKPTL